MDQRQRLSKSHSRFSAKGNMRRCLCETSLRKLLQSRLKRAMLLKRIRLQLSFARVVVSSAGSLIHEQATDTRLKEWVGKTFSGALSDLSVCVVSAFSAIITTEARRTRRWTRIRRSD